MKISIITPVFNAQDTLEKTILSVINQQCNAEIEYILIDGQSNDGTLDIINRYQDHIDQFISEPDCGVYDAMNKGVKRATGELIGIINADDWYNDRALKHVENTFTMQPDCSIFYSSIDTYFDGKYLNTFVPGNLDKFALKFTINHPSCFVKRSVYDQIGFYDVQYSIAADYDWLARAYMAGVSFQPIPFTLASYSLNGMSGKPLAKFKQIQESWQVSAKVKPRNGAISSFQRRKFYWIWTFKELLALPTKPFLNPHLSRKIKGKLRQAVGGKLPSDDYGSW